MPYRRLPNTDKARLTALEKAVAMEHECDVDKQAASYKALNLIFGESRKDGTAF